MNSLHSKQFSVGLVALVCAFAIAVGIILVGSEQQLWSGRTKYKVHFTRTNGLAVGAPVTLNGVSVGSVDKMSFPEDPEADYIDVRLTIVSHVAPRIKLDTVGQIQTFGLLGDKYIELSGGSSDSVPLEPYGLIRSVDPIDYEAILGQSGDIVSNAIEVTALLRQVLTNITDRSGLAGKLISDKEFGDAVVADLGRSMANAERATARLERMLARIEEGEGAFGVLLSEGQRTREALENMRVASTEAAEFMTRLNRGRGLLPRLVDDEAFADATLDGVQASVTSIAEITAKVRSGEGTVGKLVYDDGLYEDAQSFVGGNSTGAFWRVLWTGIKWFWPFPSNEAAQAGE